MSKQLHTTTLTDVEWNELFWKVQNEVVNYLREMDSLHETTHSNYVDTIFREEFHKVKEVFLV